MKYLTIFALLLIVIAPAHAYIDGGSGSYIIQMAMAGFLALVFTLKLAWQRVKAACLRLFSGHRNISTQHGK
jgi:hypothetical protein